MGNFEARLERERDRRDAELWDAHERGEHAEPVKDCNRCWAAAKEAAGRASQEAETRPPAPLRLSPGMTWRAGPADRIGHLLAKPRDQWYLCGQIAVLLTLAWPQETRCRHCVAVLEEREVATAHPTG